MKFHSLLAETLYENYNNGYSDDSQTDQTEDNGREFALFTDFDAGDDGIIHAILTEQESGDVFADIYPTKGAAEIAWDDIAREIDESLCDPLDFTEAAE